MAKVKVAAPKDRWTPIADADEAKALEANGKYDNFKVTWELRNGQVWAFVDEHFRAWRAARKQSVDEGDRA